LAAHALNSGYAWVRLWRRFVSKRLHTSQKDGRDLISLLEALELAEIVRMMYSQYLSLSIAICWPVLLELAKVDRAGPIQPVLS
jgi:hypothetical protein